MGKLPGYRQASLYIDPLLYEEVRCSAYTLKEDIYEFVAEALAQSIERRLDAEHLAAVRLMAKQNMRDPKNRDKFRRTRSR